MPDRYCKHLFKNKSQKGCASIHFKMNNREALQQINLCRRGSSILFQANATGALQDFFKQMSERVYKHSFPKRCPRVFKHSLPDKCYRYFASFLFQTNTKVVLKRFFFKQLKVKFLKYLFLHKHQAILAKVSGALQALFSKIMP